MREFIHIIVAIGGLAAAAAVGLMCVVCMVVWLASRAEKQPSEAWRRADKP